MKHKKIPLVVIAGPTASGKTEVSIALAKRLGAEIVSADSMQLYRCLNIGSAKPTVEEMQGIPHYLMDEIDPRTPFSVADYVLLAHRYIADIVSRGKLPILVGGTGLYINSVVKDVDFDEEQQDETLRDKLHTLAEERGGQYLLDMLAEFDPVSAARLHVNNTRRIIRAIEFYRLTGTTISEHQEQTKKKESRYNALSFMIMRDREQLYQRINQRVDIMLEQGLIDEVRGLVRMGCTKEMTSMQGIGYKEMIDYLRGFLTYDELVCILKRNTRRYAKRQLTWFRRDVSMQSIMYTDSIVDEIEQKVRKHFEM